MTQRTSTIAVAGLALLAAHRGAAAPPCNVPVPIAINTGAAVLIARGGGAPLHRRKGQAGCVTRRRDRRVGW